MKKFENPTLEIEKLNIADVITTSGECLFDCSDDGYVCPSNVTGGN